MTLSLIRMIPIMIRVRLIMIEIPKVFRLSENKKKEINN